MNIELPDKLYYSIGEVAKAFDVNASLIRFWEKEFDIIQPKKNNKGNRLFTPKDIESFKTIYYLVKVKGHTLEGAKLALIKKPHQLEEIDVVTRLENLKDELLKLKMSFEEIEQESNL
ncbi:MerR family transcriptional regulator [Faecalibacter rhinopitheci]|uniref:MerR family transcriptional regulator n=1 Tax=Faecalibacter rhinopitheci TaxID=2779678 RepID=A0A8J7FW34_9FLAO|nr:MerR family transcriptional regulator [Faecalibacter rhinopitheci]MBF0597566.1 MerR family transcriptional regulator [Faecalibacter rhinopitheci]MBQ0148644.1 MerR family transcriptional regulator [Candidatus Onthonaster equi]